MDEFIKELDGLDELVYLSDLNTYELLFINNCGLRYLGLNSRDQAVGHKCYEILQANHEPCSYCTNHLLCEEKFYEWQITNKMLGRDYLLKDKLVPYQGRLVRMEIALDVTKMKEQERRIRTMLANEDIAMKCARSLQDASDGEKALNDALAILGQCLKGDRTYIFEIAGTLLYNTYEWCAPGITQEMQLLQDIPMSAYRNWFSNFNQNKPYVITDLEEHKTTDPTEYNTLKPQGIRSLITVPLFKGPVLIGFLGVDNPPLDNGSNIVEILQLLAFFIQGSITRIKENTQLRKMSSVDEMTGARNRNAFIRDMELLDGKLRSAPPENVTAGYGAIFADINGLKERNDREGHESGDRLIRRISQKLLESFPPSQVYRTGGDEFVILFTDIAEAAFLQKAAALRQCLSGGFDSDSVSIGASWADSVIYMEEIINQAEADMYEAKKRYYMEHSSPSQSRSMYSDSIPYTGLMLRDINIATIASELLHIILEQWDPDRASTLLDEEFTLFEEEYQKFYSKEEAMGYFKKQQEHHEGQKLRDLQLIRKRAAFNVTICSCYCCLDWKTDGSRTYSIPVEMTLVFVQKMGRGRCLYMHSTNIFHRSEYEQNIDQLRRDTLFNMITRSKERKGIIEMPGDDRQRAAVFNVLSEAFSVVSEGYSNVYLVDIQGDSYITLKSEGKFQSLVGSSGNYTGINSDYAKRYLDQVNRLRYLDFTSRRNLLNNLERGNLFLNMDFSVTNDSHSQADRDIEVRIWLGTLENTAAAVFAFHTVTGSASRHIINATDRLTGLLSYEKFREDGQEAIRQDTNHWVLISSDIRNFKYINEILGYNEGNIILQDFAGCLLNMDRDRIFHTRVTADLFLTLAYCQDDRAEFVRSFSEDVENFSRRQNERIADIKFVFRTGVYLLEDSCQNIDHAIDCANLARKSIGQSINNEFNTYGKEIVRLNSIYSEIIATMEIALENKNFHVWLQPKVDLKDGSFCGAEALVRWMQGDTVRFYPNEFIPIFETNGFITTLDLYVLETVCCGLRSHIGGDIPDCCRISVNLSSKDVKQEGIINEILRIVDLNQIPHSALEFELTETAYFSNFSSDGQVMEHLKELGFITSIDDFGSGYSVMNMLVNMPATVVKIDRGFMLNSEKTERGRKFLSKLISMMHELGYRVLCEGIETKEQYEMLREMGCDEGQGYYFSKPVPMDEFFETYCGP